MASSASSGRTSRAETPLTSNAPSDTESVGLQDETADTTSPGHRVQVPIAVVGMACRLPGRNSSPTTLWEFLQRGGIADNEPPKTRFSLGGHYDKSTRPRTMKSPGGMFMEDVDPATFDGQFFNISRVDCIAMDPQQRQMLEVTYECLENAGIPLEVLSGSKTGVIVGTNFIDYNAIQNRDPEDRADSITIGVASSILSNRVSHFLNVNGPSMTIDTACSASLVSVDVACRFLDSFQADAMLVGGTNMWLAPEHNEEIGMMHITQSASGKCHSFDAKADGYVKAEGINSVYLKRLDDAIRDNDPIRAVIRGSASNASGRTAGIANPNPSAQAAVTRAAYKNAGIQNFSATQFLECHGTGTLAGDPIEVQGAASVFAKGRKDGQELIIGSIKSNIGHSEAAAGLSGLLKAAMAVERGIVPGNPTFIDPNPRIDWKASRVRASRTSIRWPARANLRRASVNSFGFGGANAHVVLENSNKSRHVSSYQQVTAGFFDDEDDMSEPEEQGPPTLLVFSANDQSSLKNYTKALSSHLMDPMVSIDPTDLAYTLSERRSKLYYRAFTTTRSKRPQLTDDSLIMGKQASTTPRIGFVFTGQGAQWSQMGAELVKYFPTARKTLKSLDKILHALPEPPSWSLYDELTSPRTSETLRQPEFSQPLVTALQLALLDVLKDWGVQPQAVIGHSSGEIAAAVAAGHISRADAIVTAFFRGQAAKKVAAPLESVGMLAVGVGEEKVMEYLRPDEGKVQIACYNSPSSLTMSGTVASLEKLRDRIQAEGHLARLLLVDLAYHSDYMAEIGIVYKQMLEDANLFQKPCARGSDVHMFSTVSGEIMQPGQKTDAAYWKSNMVSPVHFMHGMKELLQATQTGADFLIELGPSNALAGPVAQIKKGLGGSAMDVVYTSALKRGADSTLALYNTAGQLFLSGGVVNIAKVNRVDNPRVIVDLPNYAWNHSTQYWHETRASKEWRFKKFVNHDLLGSKVPATAWQSPVFKKVLKVSDVPWLRDHKLGSEMVFPASGYVAMAVEAMYQTAMSTQWSDNPPARYRFRLQDVKLLRALVLEEKAETRLTLSLTPVKGGSTRTWYEYTVCSVQEALPTDPVHSTGLVCVETDYKPHKCSEKAMVPLDLATPARVWYKALRDLGYNFGPSFQKHLIVESVVGKRSTRSTVNLEPPPSTELGQSFYPLHPAVIDSCFQTGSPALWGCDLPSHEASVLIPKVIDSIVIEANRDLPSEGLALSSAHFLGVGNKDLSRNYASNVELYDPRDGSFLFEMKGLASSEIETSDIERVPHTFTTHAWNADIEMLMSITDASTRQSWLNTKSVSDLISLVAHKNPGLTALELNLGNDDSSNLWFSDASPLKGAYNQYHFAVRDPKTLIAAQEKFRGQAPTPQFHLIDRTKPASVSPNVQFDLAVVKNSGSEIDTETTIESLRSAVRAGGFIIAVGIEELSLSRLGTTALSNDVCICQVNEDNRSSGQEIVNVSLLKQDQQPVEMVELLRRVGVEQVSQSQLSDQSTVVVVDELFHSIIDSLNQSQWDVIKLLIERRCRVLWVTTGAQLSVTEPVKAGIIGLFRTIRAEEQLRLITLDVERPAADTTVAAISGCLSQLDRDSDSMDSEFVERGGIVHISRLIPDTSLTSLQSDQPSARPTETLDLHATKAPVQLRCERLGNLDTVHFGESASQPQPLPDGMVEVEVYAAGLNYKDVVVTMGIVPGDETQLGHECAGIVTQVSDGTDLAVGDRVVVFGKGCFANRLQTTPARVHRIPDDMSLEEAATMAVVYITSIHSLFDLGNLSAGQRVLIHSAAGGVGIAAIQLARYIGAEVFVTVGSTEKREFLKSHFGLGDDRIFNSRNTDFADEILSATDGRGVDVVLNSLTGDMLTESFRILADGGIMVEIGKKDILDRNALSMQPFDRNISFRAVDLSPERASDVLVAKCLKQLFSLVKDGYVKPINPIHKFSWSDIPSAIRFLRQGTHMGKIVLSDGDARVHVPVRRAPQEIGFQDGGCILIVGGLRGLCGSLAIYLAKAGAKHLAVISRSGHTDEKSLAVIKQIRALGSNIDLLSANVTKEADVVNAFQQTAVPIVGIIQGAMVLRDRPFDQMTLQEYHEAVSCKIQGTWNLHNAANTLGLNLQFFTLLSSISGVIGNRGQANYAVGNVFLDAFAEYRRARGQAACSVDLGVIEDAGVIAENEKLHAQFDPRSFKGINDSLLRKILYLSILQQQRGITPSHLSQSQMVTGLVASQPATSILKHDMRFAALFSNQAGAGGGATTQGGNAEVQAALLLLRSESADPAARLNAMVDAVNGCFVRMLQLPEAMDPARPLSVYGIDSLSAVEVRNWVRSELGALVTTLDILNAASLTAFCEKVIAKLASE